MRIIKCDICEKELNSSERFIEYSNTKQLDLCSTCSSKFNKFKDDLNEQEKKLNKEYEEKRKRLYETITTKYGISKRV